MFKIYTKSPTRHYIIYEFLKSNYKGCNELFDDEDIARRINMKHFDFRRFIFANFNCMGERNTGKIYFPTKKDALVALEWIESKILLDKIVSDKNV